MTNLCAHHFPPLSRACVIALLAVAGDGICAEGAKGVEKNAQAQESVSAAETLVPAASLPRIYIREIRVIGAHAVSQREVAETVYPFLGPGRTVDDVEAARAALEKAYHEKGFSATQVAIPEQTGRGGLVFLQVFEGKVGALRVKGSRYFLPSNIKRHAQSLAEGKIVNFNDVQRDIVALNQLADRKVTPSIRAGAEPGTVDVDLNVEDRLPLHGSVEINNRRSANTTPLRVNASANYNNLWQLGHSVGASVQIAPENEKDAKVFSGYYIARFPNYSDVSLMFSGTKQDSNISTLGGAAVIGKGEVLGLHALVTLPSKNNFYQSLNLGFDYKHFNERIRFSSSEIFTPITYFPLSAAYSATWTGEKKEGEKLTPWITDFNLSANFHARGLGDTSAAFDSKRFKADGNYIYLRGDLSHTRELPRGWQVFAKVQGQVADQPLLNTEQFSAGGEGTVRGYLESAALGDNAVLGSIELRSPNIGNVLGKHVNEWRVYAFFDAGLLTLNEPLPEQQSRFTLASCGFGTRMRVANHLSGSFEFGLPLRAVSPTAVHEGLATFRLSADF